MFYFKFNIKVSKIRRVAYSLICVYSICKNFNAEILL